MFSVLFIFAIGFLPFSRVTGEVRHSVNDDVDEFLDAVNEGCELYGAGYIRHPLPVVLPDSSFSGLELGELSSWERKGDAYTTDDNLQDFAVEASIGLRVFQILVSNFTSSNYTGPMIVEVLDNACSMRINVKNRFQQNCNVSVGSFSFKDFGNARFYADGPKFSGFMFEKGYVVDNFRKVLLTKELEFMVREPYEEALQEYLCRGKDALMRKLNAIFSFIKETN